MMTRRLLCMFSVLLIALFVASCSDDDCPECPAPAAGPSLYALGSLAMEGPGLDAYIEVFDITSAGTEVDSVLVDGAFGHFCVRELHDVTAQDGRQVIAQVGNAICPSGALMEYTPGDTTELAMYCEGLAQTVRLPLLDKDDAQPTGLAVHVDQEAEALNLTWDAVSAAEWYAVKMKGSAVGPHHLWVYACVDTNAATLALPFGINYTTDVDIYIAAATGPKPTEDGPAQNITGDHMVGAIYSLSRDLHMHTVLIRTAQPGAGVTAPADVPSLNDLIKADGTFWP